MNTLPDTPMLGQLETSYETRKGFWKIGTVGMIGYAAASRASPN